MKILSVVGIVVFALFVAAAITISYFDRKYGVFDEEWHNVNLYYTDIPVRISFEKFTRLYEISPKKWATLPDHLLFREDNSLEAQLEAQIVLLDTYPDFKKYREWHDGKKKRERLAEEKSVQERFDDMWNSELMEKSRF